MQNKYESLLSCVCSGHMPTCMLTPSQLKMSANDGVTPTSIASSSISPCAFFDTLGLPVKPSSLEWSSDKAAPKAEARSTACAQRERTGVRGVG